MNDSGLVCMGAMIVIAYIAEILIIGEDGVIFGTVMLAIGALAGVKFQNYTTRKRLTALKIPEELHSEVLK